MAPKFQLFKCSTDTPETVRSFRALLCTMKFFGFFSNTFTCNRFVTTKIDKFFALLALVIFSFGMILNLFYFKSRPSKLNALTVPELAQLALDSVSFALVILAIEVCVASYVFRSRICNFFLTLIEVDDRLKQVAGRGVDHQVFYRRSIFFIAFVWLVQYLFSSIYFYGLFELEVMITLDFKMTIVNSIATTGYWSYMTFFIFLVYAIRLRFDEVNKILQEQFLDNVKFEPFAQSSLVKSLGIIHSNLIDLVGILNDTYSMFVGAAISFTVLLSVFNYFELFHLFKEPENLYTVLLVYFCSFFYAFFVQGVFMTCDQLAEAVSSFLFCCSPP